jgi:ketosteroid isomerase-like protein
VPDESDSVALTRAFARVGGDVDAEMSFYGPDPVYDLSAMGIGIFEGRSAIRAFLEGWMNTYESYEEVLQEIRDLGGGMAFCVIRESATPRGSDANTRIQSVYAFIVLWVNGKIARLAAYPNVEDGRAAAEQLAESSE